MWGHYEFLPRTESSRRSRRHLTNTRRLRNFAYNPPRRHRRHARRQLEDRLTSENTISDLCDNGCQAWKIFNERTLIQRSSRSREVILCHVCYPVYTTCGQQINEIDEINEIDDILGTKLPSPICVRQRLSIALQRSLAHAIHARTLRLEQSMAMLPPLPSRAPLSYAELHTVSSFV